MSDRTLRLNPSDRSHLLAGSAALGISLDEIAESRLVRFADMLDLWSRRVNLLSCGSAHELIERHLLDSLAVGPLLPSKGTIVDLGTGAGFPGLPLAILMPERPFALVEVRRRRVTFLREVRRALQLDNVEILEQRAEAPPAEYVERAAAVVTRAVWSGDEVLTVSSRWLSPSGRLYWMRSEPIPDSRVSDGVVRERRFQYRVGQGRARTVEVLKLENGPADSEFHVKQSDRE